MGVNILRRLSHQVVNVPQDYWTALLSSTREMMAIIRVMREPFVTKKLRGHMDFPVGLELLSSFAIGLLWLPVSFVVVGFTRL